MMRVPCGDDSDGTNARRVCAVVAYVHLLDFSSVNLCSVTHGCLPESYDMFCCLFISVITKTKLKIPKPDLLSTKL